MHGVHDGSAVSSEDVLSRTKDAHVRNLREFERVVFPLNAFLRNSGQARGTCAILDRDIFLITTLNPSLKVHSHAIRRDVRHIRPQPPSRAPNLNSCHIEAV